MWPQGATDRDYLTRFQAALERLSASRKPERLLLAVSGGPDSLALLLLANEVASERIVAATVDHGLRPEAAEEARFVASVCQSFGVPHRILLPDQPITGNIQSSARAVRYALLERAADEQQCTLIATAHHGDDQLETMLMRLGRGSGVSGMAGIRARNGRIIRPLLEFSKAELEEICRSAGVEPVRDPSNEDRDFDRVAMRQWLTQTAHPFAIHRAGRTAKAMGDAAGALEWMSERLAADRITKESDTFLLVAGDLPHEMQRRLLLTVLARIALDLSPRGEAIEQLLADLKAGRTTTIGNILCNGGQVWRFSPAPPRRTNG